MAPEDTAAQSTPAPAVLPVSPRTQLRIARARDEVVAAHVEPERQGRTSGEDASVSTQVAAADPDQRPAASTTMSSQSTVETVPQRLGGDDGPARCETLSARLVVRESSAPAAPSCAGDPSVRPAPVTAGDQHHHEGGRA